MFPTSYTSGWGLEVLKRSTFHAVTFNKKQKTKLNKKLHLLTG